MITKVNANVKTILMILSLIASLTYSVGPLAVELDKEAPDFTLKSSQGSNLRLEEYRGEVVLINFWATWCGPCRQEMPILDKIQERYESTGFTVLGINVEGETKKVQQLLARSDLSFPVLFDEQQEISKMYDVGAMPFTLLVDRDGVIRYVHDGYKPGDEQEYVNHLKSLLRK